MLDILVPTTPRLADMRFYSLVTLTCIVPAFAQTSGAVGEATSDPASFVNLFVGTTNGGHVFPGATLPHGMVKVGMDTDSPGNHAGYDANGTFRVLGFSQLHDDGTGGGVPLSHFKIFPSANCTSFEGCATSLDARKVLRKILPNGNPDDFASPGYFSTNLSTGVRVELTATRRTSLQRHTFPPRSDGLIPRINVDISNDGQQSSTVPTMVVDPTSGRVTGGGQFQASFGPGRYSIFTCVDFRGVVPAEYGSWLGNTPVRNITNAKQMYRGFGSQLGALLAFQPTGPSQPTVILVRTGVSYISTAQACNNAESEIPTFDFSGVSAAARASWNDVLGNIEVTIGTGSDQEDTRVLLYSSLYRTHLSPADYTGENPNWKSTEPYYDSFYCNWDTYRTLYPLMSLHDPERFALIVRGMLNIQQHEGWLPECRGATQQQFIQGGSNGDPIVSEFFVKFATHASKLNVSSAALYSALLADAENLPPDWDLQGRETDAWKKFNYIPQDLVEPGGTPSKVVSRSLEYAFDDFTISQVAKLLNKTSDAAKYSGRAGNFVNNWNPNTTVPGGPTTVKGMMQSGLIRSMQPRLVSGDFNFTDPRHCSVNDPTHATCFLDGSPLLYVPQDTAKLVELQGGTANFIDRLDFIIDNGYFDVTDEPGQQIPFMYHYANRPGLSTQRSRQTIAQFFNTTTAGLPGNDARTGAMGSYAFFYLAGLYPLPATRQLLLSSPFFPSISFTNPVFNTTTTFQAKNFGGNPPGGTGGSVFVKSVTIDGVPWKSTCFVEWDVFETGATVELELTTDITVPCGSTNDALPPSLSTGGYD
ncbi:glycoside hydrolase family 92 protein [Auriscalpium vulgare]|uniref:Glycoside hydrolase family 92 protein n=1 Tax=Auriscalpium vulgare TaxID=40419 RepID=A0ACB8R8Z8_9AGAM|nr:glycoside hydrolase family 92 protein [Auriscalpium vulgare]